MPDTLLVDSPRLQSVSYCNTGWSCFISHCLKWLLFCTLQIISYCSVLIPVLAYTESLKVSLTRTEQDAAVSAVLVCTSAAVMFYYSEICWCLQQRSAVPLIRKADVLFLQWTQVSSGLGFLCMVCDQLWSRNVSSVAPITVGSKRNRSNLTLALSWYRDHLLIMSKANEWLKKELMISSGSPWLTMYSHLLSYCFKLTRQSHYCRKRKHTQRTGSKLQIDRTWCCVLLWACVTLPPHYTFFILILLLLCF